MIQNISKIDSDIVKAWVGVEDVVQIIEKLKLDKVPIYLVYHQKNPPKRVRLLIDKLIQSHR